MSLLTLTDATLWGKAAAGKNDANATAAIQRSSRTGGRERRSDDIGVRMGSL